MSRSMTYAEWTAEAESRFGSDCMAWRFVCPACKHVASVSDWKAAGAPASAVAFSCVGRWSSGEVRDAFGLNPKKGQRTDGVGPCNYAGGGLFAINPVHVTHPGGGVTQAFEFADAKVATEAA